MAYSGTNKRRRTAADTLHISDLPIGFIVDVSAYLDKPSRAILALAFTSSSLWQNDNLMHQSSPITTAIVSASQWDILDFQDVEKELANKLTDDDINAILKCINARDVLKRIKLCGCVNITGIGLNPLRGSVVLEQIDLSLVGKYQIPYPPPKSKISEEAVVPILESIVSSVGCSLKCIQLNTNWTREWQRPYHLRDFKRRYNELFSTRRDMICSKCNLVIEGIDDWMQGNHNRKICYDCLAPICSDCNDYSRENVLNGGFCIQSCNTCDKTYCTDCVTSTICTNCLDTKCKECGEMEVCDECGEATCENCLNTCDGCNETRCDNCVSFLQCQGDNCGKGHCEDCYNGEEYDVKACGDCISTFCTDCNLDLIKTHGLECRACAPETVPLTLMLDDIAKHREEIARLRKDNEEMAKENEELREKLKRISL